jgi:predicted MFS family arabinose efflux permease
MTTVERPVGHSVQRTPPMTRRLTLAFAIAAGAAVGNLYWAQPLLSLIGRDLQVSAAAAGLLVTLTQSATPPASC